ncbi:hypothetical protein SNE40_008557 [Patella caerulea]|uniref:Uncharacterized protein n=1 Tax=Patella caerulea TaxID=87958 RepID=A0AAN8PVB6_PATCE
MSIKDNKSITGIQVQDSISFLYQHADDTTVTVVDEDAVIECFKSISRYSRASDGKVNIEKTVVLGIGDIQSDSVAINDIDIPINKNCTKILGVYLGANKEQCEILNWKEKLTKIKTILKYLITT